MEPLDELTADERADLRSTSLAIVRAELPAITAEQRRPLAERLEAQATPTYMEARLVGVCHEGALELFAGAVRSWLQERAARLSAPRARCYLEDGSTRGGRAGPGLRANPYT